MEQFAATAGAPAPDGMQAQPIGPFGGLNTNISQEAIDATQSPDLLNVDISQGGRSVKKRQGYALDATLSVSTSAAHNLYKFFDSAGNEVRLAFNDNRVNASVGGGQWSVILTTGTVGATWDCTDYLGFAYCVSSAFDNPIKTNGTIAGTTGAGGTNAIPAGSIVSNSGDRLLVGATAANPSRLYYSQSTVFSNFTLGVQPSDSSFEDIVAPGSKLTHIAYRFGRWLWWKDQSFGFIVGTGQFDLQIVVVSQTIGTLDNTDVFDGNYVYFRGSDAQIYTYDGSNLSRAISLDISPTLATANKRKANSWSQSSQTDFNAGSIVPARNLSTTISIGDVIVSSFGVVENSSTSWALGSSSNVTVSPSSMSLTINNLGTINDPSFEGTASTNYSPAYTFNTCDSVCGSGGQSGSSFAETGNNGNCGGTCGGSCANDFPAMTAFSFSIQDVNGVGISTNSLSVSPGCAWTLYTLTDQNTVGKKVRYSWFNTAPTSASRMTTRSTYLFPGTVSFYYRCPDQSGLSRWCEIDNVQGGSSTITSGSFVSKIFDTGFTSSTYQLQSDFTVNTSTPTFALLTSTATTGVFSTLLTSTGTNAVGNRYAKYTSTISINATDVALTSISTFTIISRSTGTFYSAVDNAPLLTSWSTFGVDDTTPGISSITYYTRSSTSVFTVLSATPSWVLQSKNATVSASTGTYFQARGDFYISAATETLALNDFAFNWFEGTASDKMYATYFKNGVWFSLSLGTSAVTNNRIFRYDQLSGVWTLYDIASNGFLTYNNNLYFGDPSAGKIYQFGNGIYADNGASIRSYWKSKAFFGDTPFSNKDMRMASWYIAEDSGVVLSLTYTFDESTSTTRNLNLYSSNKNIIQDNWNFPLGSISTNFNAQFGDTSALAPWEVFGGGIYFVPRPWKVNLQ